MQEDDKGKLDLLAQKTFTSDAELFRVVDFLNKTLKDKNIMFGLTKDKEKKTVTINIYEF